jgi:hypothetical protein
MRLIYTTKTWLPIAVGCCQEVLLCLTETGAGKTEGDVAYVAATVENATRNLSPLGHCPCAPNARCDDMYQYQLTISDDLLTEDLLCEDIASLSVDTCVFNTLLDLITALDARVVALEEAP